MVSVLHAFFNSLSDVIYTCARNYRSKFFINYVPKEYTLLISDYIFSLHRKPLIVNVDFILAGWYLIFISF